ncbi:ATP-binding cassette, sub-C (CFTR MRP), member 9 [Entomortierella beljakovae]|nr:ATP-binding cassette, sub-C (CFTR MRP), member 9 [Entomortierella beljakovae]
MSIFSCQNEDTWGPFNPDCPADFTPCFEDSFLRLVPVFFLAVAGIPRLITISKQSSLSHPSKNWRQTLKLIEIIALLSTTVIILVLQLNADFSASVEFLSAIIEVSSLIFALVLTVVENKKSFLSSNVLLIYWLLLICTTATKLRTLALGCPASDFKEITLYITKLAISFIVFLLESIGKDAGIRLGEDDYQKCPEDEANIFSIASFHWVTGLMRKGYAKPLTFNDLWILRNEDQSKNVSETFATKWEKELKKESPSLLRAISAAFGKPFYIAGIWKAANDILGFLQPVLLRQMLLFVMSYKTDKPQPLYRGYTIACLMLVCSVSQTVVLHQYFHLCFRVGMHIRAGLVTAIYQKSLRLSNSARQTFTVGEIVNHMSIDAQRVQDLVTYLHVVWSGLFQIVIAMYLLYDTMSWSIFAGVTVMILMIPLNARLSVFMKNFQQQQMKNKDIRIKLMNELLNGIRVIKLYAWEGTFLQKVLTVRNDFELETMKKIGYLSAIQSFTWACTPFLVSLATFSVYALVMKKPMTTDIVFTSISLFNLLQFPLAMFPSVISSAVDAYVAMGRVHKFLTSSEVDPNSIIVEDPRKLSGRNASDKYSIMVKDASYSWYKNSPPVISGINLALKKDCLLSVIGRVGSGKSSLVAALCGDLERVSGEIRIRGSVAFVPQQAWIMNDTLRANILFGNPYDPVYYQKTVEACCLQQDFDMLLGGDQTEIGERGINLSGGQKARISLARAVYSRADIYLFDDPLSAVDAHVGRTIFDKVIGPKGLLGGKARILVTHQIQYLAQSTSIMMLRGGQIVEQGTYQELMKKKTDVYQLVTEYGNDSNEEEALVDQLIINEVIEENIHLEEDVVEADDFPAEEASRLSNTPRSARRDSIRSNTSARTLRRPSVSSVHQRSKVAKTDQSNTGIISEEQIRQGSVQRSVYLAYAKACSYLSVFLYILSMVFSQGASISTSLWLTHWSSDNDSGKNNHGTMYYIGIYAALGFSYSILTVFQSIILQVHCGIRSARVLHQEMLHSILRSPMMFFDTTPMGRILNRFSKDQSTIDEVLPRSFSGYSRTLFQVASVLFVVTFSTPSFIIIIIPFGFVYLWLQRYYLSTSREIRRLDSVSRSPVFAHFQETLGGISTIRAYRQQNRFIQGNNYRLDQNLRAYYPGIAGNRWLAFRLETLSSVIIFGSAFLSVVSLSRNLSVDPGLVGLSLTYALSITQTLNWMVRQYTEIESNIVSVERVQEYIDLKPEAPEIIDQSRPTPEWPDEGRVDFVDYETRYRPGLDLVLRGVNCSIRPHEKIGICGRTGAGKSSLTLSLFRIIEAVSGQILVDGVDISKLGLYDVRSRFSIIPQDPVLFAGTIRFNLDPLGTKDDHELWQALEDSYLKEYVSQMDGGLNAMVLEGGDNFSVGQRQLICLARALLRKTSLLILDEATAAIDLETDALVQAIIRKKFANCTILTIAHRINTVMDSDRIMVLDQGRVAEFDSPTNLLADPTSIFYSLAKESDPEFTLESRSLPEDDDFSVVTYENNPTPYKPIVLNPLPPQIDLYRWPPNVNKPLCLPKIFVYPDSLKIGDVHTSEVPNVGTAYLVEEILLSQLRNKNSAAYKNYVTENPEEADFFYIPFLGSKYLANCWLTKGADGNCDVDENYAVPMLDQIQQDFPYWNRKSGRDHIMTHPMINATLSYKSKDRMQNAIFLTTVGDKRVVSGIDGRSRRFHDIVTPSASSLLDLANISPEDYLTAEGHPMRGDRDVFLLYNGRYEDVKPTDEYSAGICSLLFNGFDHQPDYKIATSWSNTEYAQLLSKSKYGLAPQGYTLDTTRIWEYIAFGVVPVVIADGIVEPFEDDVFWDSFIVRIHRQDAHKMDIILRSIPAQEYERKRQAVWEHGRQVLLNHDAWHYIVRGLCRKGRLEGMRTINREHHEPLSSGAFII